jgi:hypothetical protein
VRLEPGDAEFRAEAGGGFQPDSVNRRAGRVGDPRDRIEHRRDAGGIDLRDERLGEIDAQPAMGDAAVAVRFAADDR